MFIDTPFFKRIEPFFDFLDKFDSPAGIIVLTGACMVVYYIIKGIVIYFRDYY